MKSIALNFMESIVHNLRKIPLFFLFLLFSAMTWSHDHVGNDFSVGLKSGFFSTEATDTSLPLGVQFEYKLNHYFSMELDYLRGDSEKSGVDLDIETIAGYAVFRTKNTSYLLLKVGTVQLNTTSKATLSQDNSDVGTTYGVGAGLVFDSLISVESEYTVLSKDIKYIGLSLRFGF